MFHTNKIWTEASVRRIKPNTNPNNRAGKLWKPIPHKDVIDAFRAALKEQGEHIGETDMQLAVSPNKANLVISCRLHSWGGNTKIDGYWNKSHPSMPKIRPIISLCTSNSQEYKPTLFFGIERINDPGKYIVLWRAVSDRKQTINFDLSAEFLKTGIEHTGMQAITGGDIYGDGYDSMDLSYDAFCNWNYWNKYSAEELLCRIAHEGIISWEQIKPIYYKWKEVAEDEDFPLSLADFAFIVSEGMVKTEPTKQPFRLYELGKILWDVYHSA